MFMPKPSRRYKSTPPGLKSIRPQLSSLLCDQPSDEKTGANATLGFTYQQWWATLKATDLYATGTDFAIGVEVKEDVAILDSPDRPTTVEFCQVKKHERDGVWSWSDLLRPSPKKKDDSTDPSPLAKLYSRRHTFAGYPTKLTFVSNVAYRVPLDESGKSLQHSNGCELREFPDSKAKEVKSKISDQLEIPVESVDLANFALQRTNLPLGEQDTFVTGKLSTLSDTGRLPFKLSKPHVSARMLAAEFQQRAANTDFANTIEKLKARCLSKADMTRILHDVESAGPSIQTALEDGLTRLDREGYHYGRIKQIQRAKISLCTDLSDRTNNQAIGLSRLFAVCSHEAQIDLDSMATLGTMMEFLVERSVQQDPVAVSGVSNGYLCGLALLVINHAINIDLFLASAGSQSKKA